MKKYLAMALAGLTFAAMPAAAQTTTPTSFEVKVTQLSVPITGPGMPPINAIIVCNVAGLGGRYTYRTAMVGAVPNSDPIAAGQCLVFKNVDLLALSGAPTAAWTARVTVYP